MPWKLVLTFARSFSFYLSFISNRTRRVKDDQNRKVDSSLRDTKFRSIKNGNPDTSSGLLADRRWLQLSSR
ncbi:hypothetical protein DPMN_169548 [Dreissena polymorpha]|uniref:Uncharacterized protein n=1 Tax=Dreissena polymorpha TaxID=45954 RepID=A0A9D4IAR2_DREPO|nr:hypothetical protein DPMN_169548 [Dreissena polymorpha]